jgi:hypothetical protein
MAKKEMSYAHFPFPVSIAMDAPSSLAIRSSTPMVGLIRPFLDLGNHGPINAHALGKFRLVHPFFF